MNTTFQNETAVVRRRGFSPFSAVRGDVFKPRTFQHWPCALVSAEPRRLRLKSQLNKKKVTSESWTFHCKLSTKHTEARRWEMWQGCNSWWKEFMAELAMARKEAKEERKVAMAAAGHA